MITEVGKDILDEELIGITLRFKSGRTHDVKIGPYKVGKNTNDLELTYKLVFE